jgi:hypothetical protein
MDEIARRASEANRILKEPLLREVLDKLRGDLYRSIPVLAGDRENLQLAALKLAALDDLEDTLRSYVKRGIADARWREAVA